MKTSINIYKSVLGEESILYILIGGLNSQDPKSFMDKQVARITQGNPYAEFIDKHLDNPYIRIVITNINTLNFYESECDL